MFTYGSICSTSSSSSSSLHRTMKSSIIIILSIVVVVVLLSPAMAFVPPPSKGGLTATSSSSSSSSSVSKKSRLYMAEERLAMTPDIEAAIANVRAAADEFGTETSHFANVWIDRIVDGNRDTTSAGLLEECILDDGDDTTDKCRRFELALTRLDNLLGVGAKEQY